MKKMKLVTLAMCLLAIFSCSTKQGTGALIGTGGGAVQALLSENWQETRPLELL